MDKCHKGDHKAIEANHNVIDELQKLNAALQAENHDLRRGIVENKELAMTMIPTDLFDNFQSENERQQNLIQSLQYDLDAFRHTK